METGSVIAIHGSLPLALTLVQWRRNGALRESCAVVDHVHCQVRVHVRYDFYGSIANSLRGSDGIGGDICLPSQQVACRVHSSSSIAIEHWKSDPQQLKPHPSPHPLTLILVDYSFTVIVLILRIQRGVCLDQQDMDEPAAIMLNSLGWGRPYIVDKLGYLRLLTSGTVTSTLISLPPSWLAPSSQLP